MECMDIALEELAAAHGVATWYRDAQRRRVDVDPDVVRRVLGLLGVTADTPAQVRDALAAVRQPGLPGTVVLRQGQRQKVRDPGVLTDERGTEMPVSGALPAGLAPGWYSLSSGEEHTTVLVAPPTLPEPPRSWGWMLQLYALRSARSWGIGDLADLREFLTWTATAHDSGAVLVNPLHAVTPTFPVQPSPYSPSSRRFINPLYLRITDIGAYRRADPVLRAEVDALWTHSQGTHSQGDRLEGDRLDGRADPPRRRLASQAGRVGAALAGRGHAVPGDAGGVTRLRDVLCARAAARPALVALAP
jgi:4-alpha-glucanotransferase